MITDVGGYIYGICPDCWGKTTMADAGDLDIRPASVTSKLGCGCTVSAGKFRDKNHIPTVELEEYEKNKANGQFKGTWRKFEDSRWLIIWCYLPCPSCNTLQKCETKIDNWGINFGRIPTPDDIKNLACGHTPTTREIWECRDRMSGGTHDNFKRRG